MAGYTTIVIGGQQVGLRFGVAALRIAAQKKAIKIVGETLETPDTISTAHYLHAAYIDNCYVEEIPAAIKFKAFVEWCEDQMLTGSDELIRVSQVITDSNTVKSKQAKGDKKKGEEKSTGMKSKPSA